jgi:hypothetical protein
LAIANTLVICPEGRPALKAGEEADALLLAPVLSNEE